MKNGMPENLAQKYKMACQKIWHKNTKWHARKYGTKMQNGMPENLAQKCKMVCQKIWHKKCKMVCQKIWHKKCKMVCKKIWQKYTINNKKKKIAKLKNMDQASSAFFALYGTPRD